jgi:hypothetical protein
MHVCCVFLGSDEKHSLLWAKGIEAILGENVLPTLIPWHIVGVQNLFDKQAEG